jgi:hypothetical protein
MAAFALVGQEESDIQGLQGRFVERQRAFDVAYGQNDVIEHGSLLQILVDQYRAATPSGPPIHLGGLPASQRNVALRFREKGVSWESIATSRLPAPGSVSGWPIVLFTMTLTTAWQPHRRL